MFSFYPNIKSLYYDPLAFLSAEDIQDKHVQHMEVILTTNEEWRQGTNFPSILRQESQSLPPTLYSLLVLNLPPPTHPSLPSITWNTSAFLFPFPCYLFTVSLFHFILTLSFLFSSLAFIFLSSFYSSFSYQACIIGIKILSTKIGRNWKATSSKRQDFLQVLCCSEKTSGTTHNAELYWVNN